MSQERKILVARRRNERSACPSLGQLDKRVENDSVHKPIKRPLKNKTNLAQDRLKRLRKRLNDEIVSSADNVSVFTKSSNAIPTSNESIKNVFKADFLTEDFSLSSDIEMLDCSDTSSAVTESSPQLKVTENVAPKNVAQANVIPQSHTTRDIPEFVLNKKMRLYIVTDTNILLSHLNLVKEVIGMKKGHIDPVIFVPWIVNEELDFIKDSPHKNAIKAKAQLAIKYIEEVLSSKNKRFQMQTLWDVNDQKFVGDSQDNKIITCCFEVKQKYQNMVLLTNDTNLRNKASIHNIPTCRGSDLFEKVMKKTVATKTKEVLTIKTHKIMEKMVSLCSYVIEACAKKAYGSLCYSMEICQSKAKSLEECVFIFKKYWFPVFQPLLIKQCEKALNALSSFIFSNTQITDDSSQMKELIMVCVRFCVYFKEIEGCRNFVEDVINDLKGYLDQCKNL